MRKDNSTIRHLAASSNRKNKSRSLLIMLAIVLSTVLLTMISSYGIGLIKYEKASAASNYGSFYGMFSGVDKKQLEAVKANEAFADVGIMNSCGYVESESDISLAAMDSKAKELSAFEDKIAEGREPVKADEIMASQGMFKALGYEKVRVGDKVKISYRPDLDSTYADKELTVSGIIRDTDAEEAGIDAGSYTGFVSEAFFEENCSEDKLCTVLFTMAENIEINNENAEEIIGGYADECGIMGIQLRVNTMYILLAMSPSTEVILTCALLIICVILFSMIVIYNIFQISLVQRMQEYGRIKAVGATTGQMKRIISREGMALALPAVPLGAAIGYLAAYLSFGWLTETVKNIQNTNIEEFTFFSPWAVFGSMILSFMTVWLALVKPKRTIARISAVEAIDYREGAKSEKPGRRKRRAKRAKSAGTRKGYESVNELRLALANIASDKKHSAMTMTTMGLTCVLFVVMANCVGNIDTQYEARKSVPHGQFQIELDYTFYDKAYPENNLDTILKDNPLNGELVKEIKDVKGVTDVTYEDMLVINMNGQFDSVEVLNREDFRLRYERGAAVGDFDYDSATEKNQIIYGWSAFLEESGMKIGDKISGTLNNGSEDKDFAMNLGGSFGNSKAGWGITEDTARKLGFRPGESMGIIWVDCSEADAAQVEEQLRNILADKKHVDMESLSRNMAEQEFGGRIIKSAVYALLIAIGVIGFANLANMMIINITTKRREYGIMQAVGMTDRQLGRSLSCQGLIYIGGTLAVAMAAGIPLGYLTFAKCREAVLFGMNVYHFPGPELVLMTVVLVAMQLTLSYLLSRNLKRESLVERIRY